MIAIIFMIAIALADVAYRIDNKIEAHFNLD